ncbi:hypothetical protein EJB05_15803, partial [Eragrostis curvula]
MLLHLFLVVATSSAVPVIGDGDPLVLGIPIFSYFCNSTSVRRTYLLNSTFEANLNKLFATLPAGASATLDGFYKGSVGGAPDTVYALALCRGDTNSSTCAACLSTASSFQGVESLCNRSRDVTMYFEECHMRFFDQDFITGTENQPGTIAGNMKNITEPMFPGWDPANKENVEFVTATVMTFLSGNSQDPIQHSCNFRFITIYVKIFRITSSGSQSMRKNKHVIIIIATAVVTLLVLLLGSIIIAVRCIRSQRKGKVRLQEKPAVNSNQKETLMWTMEGNVNSDFSLFDFAQLQVRTGNFSEEYKLGQGGFGPVYKGKLSDGFEIAVKRLSTSSGQAYVAGKEEKRALLDWRKRITIIEGIAHGLLYLHKHSRLRIIHRDLKASNILLDENMNPKISDFGIAKIFTSNDIEGNTTRVVGTYGYMAPEYASEGLFSIKSDVFSFGVLLLEIVTGKRNSGFHRNGGFVNLLGYAWQLMKEGKWKELVDPLLDIEHSTSEPLKCINIALLCVQEKPVDRPTMWDVIKMLSTVGASLPEPGNPPYYNVRLENKEALAIDLELYTINEVIITELEGR